MILVYGSARLSWGFIGGHLCTVPVGNRLQLYPPNKPTFDSAIFSHLQNLPALTFDLPFLHRCFSWYFARPSSFCDGTHLASYISNEVNCSPLRALLG